MGWPIKPSNSNITDELGLVYDELLLSNLNFTKLKLDRAEKKLKELEEALGGANARNDELEKQLREESKQRRCLEKHLEKTSKEIQGTHSNLNAELESEKSRSMSSQQKLSEAKNTEQILKESNASNTNLTKTLERLEKPISDQDKDAVSLIDALDAAKEMSYSKDKELSSFKEQMSSAIHDLTSAIHDLTTHQDEFSQAHSNLQSTEQELTDAKQNYLKLIIDHHNLKSHLDDIHQEYELKIKQSKNVAKLELQELCSSKFETMMKQMVKMCEQDHQKRDSLTDSLKEELASLKKEVDNLKRQQAQMQRWNNLVPVPLNLHSVYPSEYVGFGTTVDEQRIRQVTPKPEMAKSLSGPEPNKHINNVTQAELPGPRGVPSRLPLSPGSADVNQGHPSRSLTTSMEFEWVSIDM